MTSPKHVLKSVGPKLVPFFKTLAIYFVVFPDFTKPSFLSISLKCLPIISLQFFVLMHGMSLGDEYTYARRILIGLIFSCLGDGLLVIREYFLFGMAAFGVAHLFYISALGFKPLKLRLGVILYALAVTASLFTLQTVPLEIKICAPLYAMLLATMVWRAVARLQIYEDLWTWTKLCSCFGAILFGISDGLLSFDEFVAPISHAQVLIMSTYYAAQLGIALSVVDSKGSYIREKEDHRKQELPEKQRAGSIQTAGSIGPAADDLLRQRRPIPRRTDNRS